MLRLLHRHWPPLVALTGLCVSLPLWWIWAEHGVWALHHTIGVAIIIPSFVMWAIARYQLGAAFTPRPEATELVTRGLYARIRNPIYVFGEFLSVGLVVYYDRPWLMVPLLILTVVQVRRARIEARVLHAAFGDAYRAYRAKTWF
jgi:protein-S-isoprenylcysteine O-methyltransferase Ste14